MRIEVLACIETFGSGMTMLMSATYAIELAEAALLQEPGLFVVIVGTLALLDWATGGGWWVQWVRGDLGGISVLRFLKRLCSARIYGPGGRRADDPAGVGAPRAPDPTSGLITNLARSVRNCGSFAASHIQ